MRKIVGGIRQPRVPTMATRPVDPVLLWPVPLHLGYRQLGEGHHGGNRRAAERLERGGAADGGNREAARYVADKAVSALVEPFRDPGGECDLAHEDKEGEKTVYPYETKTS